MQRKTTSHLGTHNIPNFKFGKMPLNQMFLYLGMVGITFLFGGLISSFFYAGLLNGFQKFSLPVIFHANTIIMLTSSFTLHFAILAMRKDEMQLYFYGMLFTFLLGLAFVVFQFIGWYELSSQGIKINSVPTGSYLYMVSGLHALHFVVGIVVLGVSTFKAYLRLNDPVKDLLFSSNVTQKLNVELTAIYWHYVDVLWVLLYLLFVICLYVI